MELTCQKKARMTSAVPSILVVSPTVMDIKVFLGDGPVHGVEEFCRDVRAVWRQTHMNIEAQNHFLWSHLADSVRMELHCHDLDRDHDPEQILACLRNIYGERRSWAQLMTILCRVEQGPGETIRAYSHRLCAAFRALTARQKELNVPANRYFFLKRLFC